MSITTRFAPSPTGPLHLGHAYSAWVAWRRARVAGGRFLLRLEDLDGVRCRPEFARAILEDLTWLGVGWDGPVRVQSDHLTEYEAALAGLRGRGVLYPCFCSRADIRAAAAAPHGPDGPIYPGTCRALSLAERDARLAAGHPHAWRLDTAGAQARVGRLSAWEDGEGRRPCDPSARGDVVLGRRDGGASYHLAATHDDAATGVTLVTRGADLRAATAVHRLLQALMGWPEPAYAHHPLLADASGRRLAKRDGAASIGAMRLAGHSAAAVLAGAATGRLAAIAES